MIHLGVDERREPIFVSLHLVRTRGGRRDENGALHPVPCLLKPCRTYSAVCTLMELYRWVTSSLNKPGVPYKSIHLRLGFAMVAARAAALLGSLTIIGARNALLLQFRRCGSKASWGLTSRRLLFRSPPGGGGEGLGGKRCGLP